MTKERDSANNTVLPKLDRRTILTTVVVSPLAPLALAGQATARPFGDPKCVAEIQARLDYFAEITETTPPPLPAFNEDDELDRGLIHYCLSEGVSFDWLFFGDQRALLFAFRETHIGEHRFSAAQQELSDPHIDWLKKWQELTYEINFGEHTEAEGDAIWGEREALSAKIYRTPTRTRAGIIAQLDTWLADYREIMTHDGPSVEFERIKTIHNSMAHSAV